MNMLERVRQSLKSDHAPTMKIGDTVRVHVKIVEGERERVQAFEGILIARHGSLNTATFTVRKISHGVGVERISRCIRQISKKSKSYVTAGSDARNSTIFAIKKGKRRR